MKVSVLGAGPAGSTAAYYLAQSGIDVEFIDRVEFPRDKPCAGGLFHPLLYHRTFPYIKEAEGKYIYTVKFYCTPYETEYTSPLPLLKMFVREEFDCFLFNKALELGVKFFVGKKPEGDILIDATGAQKADDYPRAGICLVNDFETKEEIDTVHIHYGFQGIKGYCWLYPKEGYANIGIGAYLPQRNIKSIYEAFIDHLEKSEIVSVEGRSSKVKIIPFAPIRRFYTDNTLIVGDSAGFVSPSTGEGIYFAMLSGKIAARTIIEGKEFSWYERECKREFGEYLRLAMVGRTRRLLNRVLQKAIKIAEKDESFKKMLADNFFRLDKHRLGWRFFINTLLHSTLLHGLRGRE